MTEFANTVQTFVDDLCSVETIGGVVHPIFASTRRELHSPHNVERAVEVRLVVPPDRIDGMARAMLAGRVEAEAGEERAALKLNETAPVRLHPPSPGHSRHLRREAHRGTASGTGDRGEIALPTIIEYAHPNRQQFDPRFNVTW